MGRLSPFAKNRILNLRFQKNFRIKQIASTLFQEDNIKVSRKSISTFLKKYIETKSIHDKPRSGRNKKLTPEEINLIGEVTRLNRDITAPKIKEYLNLNVSTYTILRASKLFEWNKLNPNSNQAKKAAALERQLNGETTSKKRKANAKTDRRNLKKAKKTNIKTNSDENSSEENVNEKENDENMLTSMTSSSSKKEPVEPNPNLNLVPESELLLAKNASSSPMVFATKVLYKIFDLNELIGHNVSGKTFNKYIKNKKALDEKRINYIRWLVENNFESNNREELWKSCRTAINKSIRNNEIKLSNTQNGLHANSNALVQNGNFSIIQITNDLSPSSLDDAKPN